MSATVVETVDRKVSAEGGGSNGGVSTSNNNNAPNNSSNIAPAGEGGGTQNGGSITGESATAIQEQSQCLQSLKMCCKSINFGKFSVSPTPCPYN